MRGNRDLRRVRGVWRLEYESLNMTEEKVFEEGMRSGMLREAQSEAMANGGELNLLSKRRDLTKYSQSARREERNYGVWRDTARVRETDRC